MVTRTIISLLLIVLPVICQGEQSVVPQNIIDNNDFRQAAAFIERYRSFLSEQPSERRDNALRRAKEDGFEYIAGNDNVMAGLTGNEDFSIIFENGTYLASWSQNGSEIVTCSFPANIFLMSFSDKIGLETKMIEDLQRLSTKRIAINRPKRKKADLKPVSLSEFHIEDKGFYITPRLKHQIVFCPLKESDDSCVMLTDSKKYLFESIANMMISGYSDKEHKINLRIDRYGYSGSKTDISLATLVDYLSKEGCVPFWGIDSYDNKTIKGIYVWINRPGGYAHMMSVSMDANALEKNTDIKAKMHCFIRLDNLKTLFEEYTDL